MGKIWQSKEWKERRRKFLEGKVCERCKSSENLHIHHYVSPMSYQTIRRIIVSERPDESEDITDSLAKDRQKKEWEDYDNFKFVSILCKRCHFGSHEDRFSKARSRIGRPWFVSGRYHKRWY